MNNATPKSPHLTDKRVQKMPTKSSCRIQSHFCTRPRTSERTMTIAIRAKMPHLNRKATAGGRCFHAVSRGSFGLDVIFSTADGFILCPSARTEMLKYGGCDLSVRGRQYYPRQCA